MCLSKVTNLSGLHCHSYASQIHCGSFDQIVQLLNNQTDIRVLVQMKLVGHSLFFCQHKNSSGPLESHNIPLFVFTQHHQFIGATAVCVCFFPPGLTRMPEALHVQRLQRCTCRLETIISKNENPLLFQEKLMIVTGIVSLCNHANI